MGAEMIRSAGSQKGFLMLEVLIALLIFSIGVLGMVMMQGISSANSTNSEDRATAALLANDLIAELWAAKPADALPAYTPAAPADYTTVWQPRVVAALRGGSGTLVIAGNRATVTITWQPQARAGTQPATYSTQVSIL
jgi:type IV pilus assembly protein PilV